MRVKATGSFIINTMYRGDEKNRNGMVSPVGGKNQCRTTSGIYEVFRPKGEKFGEMASRAISRISLVI